MYLVQLWEFAFNDPSQNHRGDFAKSHKVKLLELVKVGMCLGIFGLPKASGIDVKADSDN